MAAMLLLPPVTMSPEHGEPELIEAKHTLLLGRAAIHVLLTTVFIKLQPQQRENFTEPLSRSIIKGKFESSASFADVPLPSDWTGRAIVKPGPDQWLLSRLSIGRRLYQSEVTQALNSAFEKHLEVFATFIRGFSY